MIQDIKGYQVREEIGEGGFGKVFRAFQPLIEREVAIKAILPVYANLPEFIRRFEAEAQLVARLEHPHIVPLYDYWRDHTGAYLVMRFLRGGNLQDLLMSSSDSLDLMTAAKFLDQITDALNIAHRHQVVHQDIKPENILLDNDGNAYLTDFGIAQDLVSGLNLAKVQDSDMVHGSPAYISPEHFLQVSVTHKSDIYSLGLLLYEMLTGEKPWETDETDQVDFLKKRFKVQELPPVQKINPNLPDGLNEIVWKATARKPANRYDSVTQMAVDFQRAIRKTSYPSAPTTVPRADTAGMEAILDLPIDLANPYKGLRPFQEADASDFFGRDTLIKRLSDRLTETSEYENFLAVIGPSGSGKSSVVKAGLIPAIRGGNVDSLANAFVVQMTPGSHPLRELEGAILSIATRADDDFITNLSIGNYQISEIVNQALPPDGSQLLLFIDQFEEIFTLVTDEDMRVDFLQKISTSASATNSRVKIIVTLRADFYDRPLMYPGFGEVLQSRTEVVLPLTAKELELAIRGPAERIGLVLETGLVETIVNNVGQQPNTLPLLQYALTELFERRSGLQLTVAAYQSSGGISGALAKRAEETYDGFDRIHREATRQLMLRLVNLGDGTEDTRRRALQSELRSLKIDNVVMQQVMDAFGRFRLLTFDNDPSSRTPTVEVAHEALIRSWGRLREWLNTNRDELRTQARLSQTTQEWINAQRDTSFLVAGARLAQFEPLIESDVLSLSSDEEEFLDASLALRRRNLRRRNAFLTTLVVVSVVAVVAAVLALNLKEQADQSRHEAELAEAVAVSERDRADLEAVRARSGELAALSLVQKDKSPDLALLLSLEAVELMDTAEARNSLLTALQSEPQLEAYLNGHSDWVRSVVYSPDGHLIASGGRDNTIILWDADTYQKVGQPLVGHTDWINALAFSPDGKVLASAGRDSEIRLWDIESQKPIGEPLLGHEQEIRSMTFAPHDTLLVSAGEDGTIRLWDTESGQEVREPLEGHGDEVYAVAISPDGSILASGNDDGTIQMWDMTTFESQLIEGHEGFVLDLAFRFDGAILASSSADTTVRLWQANSGVALATVSDQTDYVYSVDFYPEGALLVAAGHDGSMRFWNTATGQFWRTYTNVQEEKIRSVAFDPNNPVLAVAGQNDSVTLWSLDESPVLGQILTDHSERVAALAFSPDQPLLASAGGIDTDTAIRLWDATRGDLQATLEGHGASVTAVAFNPIESDQLTSVSLDHTALFWNTKLGERIGSIELADSIFSVAYSPGGELVALGSHDGSIRLWNIAGSPDVWRSFGDPLNGHDQRVLALAFHPDGELLASASRDGTIRLWDVAAQIQVGEALTKHEESVMNLAFSPDGRLLASGSRDTTILLWDTATWQPVGEPLDAHEGFVQALTFSPDGRLLASGDNTGNIILWDVPLRRQIGEPLIGHNDWINALAFSADGKLLASGSQNVSVPVILWSVGMDAWRERACAIANRNLNASELQQYFLNTNNLVDCIDP